MFNNTAASWDWADSLPSSKVSQRSGLDIKLSNIRVHLRGTWKAHALLALVVLWKEDQGKTQVSTEQSPRKESNMNPGWGGGCLHFRDWVNFPAVPGKLGSWEAGKRTAGLNGWALGKHMDPGSATGKLNYSVWLLIEALALKERQALFNKRSSWPVHFNPPTPDRVFDSQRGSLPRRLD